MHQPVIGGKQITEASGFYPVRLAKTLVDGMERTFEAETFKLKQNITNESFAAEQYDIASDEEEILDRDVVDDDSSDGDHAEKHEPKMRISAGLKSAIKRLHENTGHRSNLRLARALAISGAPAEAIYAAKTS